MLKDDIQTDNADGTPLLASKRKHDSGDLMGIIFVSVKDVERIYRDSSLLHSGKYDAASFSALSSASFSALSSSSSSTISSIISPLI